MLDDSTFDESLIATLQRTADLFDRRYSRFRDDSLVSELFQTGRLSHPPAEMLSMLDFAEEMYEISGGAFDPTISNDLHRMGYGRRNRAVHVRDASVWPLIVATPAKIIMPAPVMLDFGAFGKGWLIDQFVRDLKLAGKQQFIVNGGGGLYVWADEPISFQLEDPYETDRSIGSIKIKRGALAGSNTIKRSWQDGEQRKHHIVDPATHDSSQSGVIASFVAAESALIADTMATILILRPELETTLSTKCHLKTELIVDR